MPKRHYYRSSVLTPYTQSVRHSRRDFMIDVLLGLLFLAMLVLPAMLGLN